MAKISKETKDAQPSQITTTPENQTNQKQNNDKIPPIVITNKEKWLKASIILKNANIQVLKAQITHDGIRMHLTTTATHGSYLQKRIFI